MELPGFPFVGGRYLGGHHRARSRILLDREGGSRRRSCGGVDPLGDAIVVLEDGHRAEAALDVGLAHRVLDLVVRHRGPGRLAAQHGLPFDLEPLGQAVRPKRQAVGVSKVEGRRAQHLAHEGRHTAEQLGRICNLHETRRPLVGAIGGVADVDRLIGELQHLDVLQQIRVIGELVARRQRDPIDDRACPAIVEIGDGDETVAVQVVSGLRDVLARIIEVAIPVEVDEVAAAFDPVLGEGAAEHGGVDVVLRGVVILDLAHDAHVARLDGSVEQERLERASPEGKLASLDIVDPTGLRPRHHRVGGERLGGILGAADHDADPHVQPGIAVDEIITAAPHDDVVAVAAHQDVTVTVARDVCARDGAEERLPRAAHPLLKAVDAIDTFLGENVVGEARFRLGARSDTAENLSAVVARKPVIELPARQGLHLVEAIAQDLLRVGGEDRDRHVVVDTGDIELGRAPVESEHAFEALDADARQGDVVPRFQIVVLVVALTPGNVVADDRGVEEQLRVLAGDDVEAFATLDPVVALTAVQQVGAGAAKDEVVPLVAEGFGCILAEEDRVAPLVAEGQREAPRRGDDVVAGVAAQEILPERILDDVVAIAAINFVGALAAVDVVVAAIAPDGVVADVGNQPVITLGAADHHVFAAAEAQRPADVVAAIRGHAAVGAGHLGIERLQDRIVPHRIETGAIGGSVVGVVVLLSDPAVQLEDHVGRDEDMRAQMRRVLIAEIAVAHDDVGERVLLKLVEHVQTLRAGQVVEPVAVLQALHLVFEDEVEGRAQHAAEFVQTFGEAANPEVDIVEPPLLADIVTAGVEEIDPVLRCPGAAKDEQGGRIALRLQRPGILDRGVGPVGGNEIDHRERVLDVLDEIVPARVGLQVRQAEIIGELRAGLVERRHAGLAAAGDVERGEIERQAEEVRLQRRDDELVDLVADVARHAAQQRALNGCDVRAAVEIFDRVQKGLDQGELIAATDDAEIVVEPVDRAVQHRVTEPVHGVGELGDDRAVDIGGVGEHERIDGGLDASRELFEDHVLVLHLGREAPGLEQARPVPFERRVVHAGRDRIVRAEIDQQPLVDEGPIAAVEDGLLVGFDDAVVLRVEHGVNRGQADVLVAPAVARDEVPVEKLVVILGDLAALVCAHRVAGHVVAIGCDRGNGHFGRARIAVMIDRSDLAVRVEQVGGNGGVGDVGQEGDATGEAALGGDTLGGALLQPGFGMVIIGRHHQLGIALVSHDQVTVLVGQQQRNAVHVGVLQADAEHRERLRLDFSPVGKGAVLVAEAGAGPAVEQVTGGIGLLAVADILANILAEEDLMRGVRGIGLVLVDPWGGGVDVLRGAVGVPGRGGAGQRHEAQVLRQIVGRAEYLVGARNQRIVGLERDIDRTIAALVDEIETVVEELAEDRHGGVEGGRETDVGRLVLNDQPAVLADLNAELVEPVLQSRRGLLRRARRVGGVLGGRELDIGGLEHGRGVICFRLGGGEVRVRDALERAEVIYVRLREPRCAGEIGEGIRKRRRVVRIEGVCGNPLDRGAEVGCLAKESQSAICCAVAERGHDIPGRRFGIFNGPHGRFEGEARGGHGGAVGGEIGVVFLFGGGMG
ncbi:hypothetical protein LOS8367_02172 [Limimaricola soesokkakensis]|uniref:Uncharacterized protein n=1 Tax=Limimaricola soesokkakensis TaxID=1343159 RepID=A0A1X6ZDF4_9RHOB|nr:hypothetical protein LOS8367_02172 [Limimaricola soesokkakensis]